MPTENLALEVTAFNPANGKSKLLSGEELADLLGLLAVYEEAMREGGQAGGASRLSRSLTALAERGIDPQWFEQEVAGGKPLFVAKLGGRETPGRRLKDLLEVARGAGVIARPAASPKDKLILVVDDDDTFREMLAFSLRKEGFQVELYVDGAEMIAALHALAGDRPPHLILLDLMMPRQGGFEVLRELQVGPLSRVPIIVLSGRNVDSEMGDSLRNEANVVQFFAKPVRPKELTGAIHQILKTRP